jgi:CubicO group peptidase (beta-lactamase class C family)
VRKTECRLETFRASAARPQKPLFPKRICESASLPDGQMKPLLRLAFAAFFVACVTPRVSAEPLEHWQAADPTTVPAEGLKALRDYTNAFNPTAVMIVRDDRVVATAGDVTRKVNVASVRKSLLSALYGIAIAEGRICLASSLAQLGNNDKPPALTDAEKQANVRDLLMARSGVYHLAAYETAEIRLKRPERGSHPPGAFWFYNNWDFNVLGAIYRQATGEAFSRASPGASPTRSAWRISPARTGAISTRFLRSTLPIPLN